MTDFRERLDAHVVEAIKAVDRGDDGQATVESLLAIALALHAIDDSLGGVIDSLERIGDLGADGLAGIAANVS